MENDNQSLEATFYKALSFGIKKEQISTLIEKYEDVYHNIVKPEEFIQTDDSDALNELLLNLRPHMLSNREFVENEYPSFSIFSEGPSRGDHCCEVYSFEKGKPTCFQSLEKAQLKLSKEIMNRIRLIKSFQDKVKTQ